MKINLEENNNVSNIKTTSPVDSKPNKFTTLEPKGFPANLKTEDVKLAKDLSFYHNLNVDPEPLTGYRDHFKQACLTPCQVGVDRGQELPEWFDHAKFEKGVDFFKRYTVGVGFATVEGYLAIARFSTTRKVLKMTGKSYSVSEARTRYFSTLFTIFRWYNSDPKDLLSQNPHMKRVNNFHRSVAKKARNTKVDKTEKLRKMKNIHWKETFNENLAILREKNPTIDTDLFWFYENNGVPFSELDMIHTQMAFCGDFLLAPEHFGVQREKLTYEEVEGFIHTWRFFTYCLGMSDEYNLCQESVQESLERMWAFNELLMKPALLHFDKEALHVSYCYIKAFFLPSTSMHLAHSYEAHGLKLDLFEEKFSPALRTAQQSYRNLLQNPKLHKARSGLSVVFRKVFQIYLSM